MYKRFQLNNQVYECIAIAQDQSYRKLGKVVVYREIGGQRFFTMPLKELEDALPNGKTIDWVKRLQLYKERFISRTDVFAERYFNQKTKRYAYSPAAPWENGRKSETVRFPLTDEIIMRHLNAADPYVIGIYPLTEKNLTRFLVIDIDGHHENQPWRELRQSMDQVCLKYQVPHLVELSQSGNGCHIWFFFAQELSAIKARQLGDSLLRATQAIDPRLSFSAFDRLFPSQDQLGGKQLGSLIAAPLAGNNATEGRSVFVDSAWQPLADQWEVLKEVQTLSLARVEEIVQGIESQIGFRLFESEEKVENNLFESGLVINQSIDVIRANALYFKKSELTAEQLLELKWLASFYNPQFYQAQRSRLSVYNIPRIITLFQESSQYLILPRGLEDRIRGSSSQITWLDKTATGASLSAEFLGELRVNQRKAFESLIHSDTGILSARTGFGKTVIAAAMIAARQVSTLILVKNKTLAIQWQRRCEEFLKIHSEPIVEEYTPTGRKRRKSVIGSYYGSKKNISGLVDIATVQSVGRLNLNELREFLDRYGMVISDEVHHDSAWTFDAVIKQVKSRYLYGLSATPYRRDGQEPIILMRFGPVRYRTEAIDPVYAKTVERLVIPRFTNLGMTDLEMLNNGRTENNLAIMNDTHRNQMIIRDCQKELQEGRHAIVLTNLVAHVDQLLAQLPKEKVFRIYGGFSSKQRAEELARLNSHEGGYIILATISTAGEGLDLPSLDTLLLAMPVSFRGNVEQIVGRLHRGLEEKNELRIYDYVDMFVPMLFRMYRKRLKAYKYLQYQIVEDEFSKQKGLQFFDGKYQSVIKANIGQGQKLVVICPKLGFALKVIVNEAAAQGLEVRIYSQEIRDESVDNRILWTFSERILPSCIIIDQRQLWLSTVGRFVGDTDMVLQIDHPELVRNFQQMLEHMIDDL